MAIGRISGPLLSKNLLRDGIDLAFETDLLYLDVTNGRIGIKKTNPAYELDVAGTINAKSLKVVYTGPGTGTAELGKLTFAESSISSTGTVSIQSGGEVLIKGNTTVTGNIHATGNISADGDIILGNNGTDTIVFDGVVKSDIVPDEDNTYSIGSTERKWLDAYVENLVTSKINNPSGNISINPAGGLLEINSDIRVKGTNPIGTAPVVTNVLFVTMDGNDTNDGRAEDPSRACKSITAALRSPYYRPGTLIRVRSGHYLENNPLLLLPNTAIVGDDLRTTSLEPINKTQDLFHLQSGCYLAQMQFYNGRSGILPGPYAAGSNRGAYCTAFPPLVNGAKLDVYQSPYIQNCTNQSGPWLIDGTLFVPNQTIQLPSAVAITSFSANTSTIVVTISTGTISPGMNVISGPADPGFFNARTLMLANKEFIKEQVIEFVNQNFPELTYEQAKCARDVGIIVENVAYDATFGGNEKSVESGLAYWNGVINLIEGQQSFTIPAIDYINTLSQYIITNSVAPVLTTSSIYTQTINTALVGGVVASEEITAGINIITKIISSGTSYAPPIFRSCGPEAPLVSAEVLLQANRTFFQEEVTAYVDAQYPNFEYKKDFCYRDVGLMVDAISQDILVGGNTKTVECALSYYTGGKGDSSVAAQSLIDNITTIKTIFNDINSTPEITSGPNLGTGFSNAKEILMQNMLFVQNEVSAYIRSLFDNTFRLTQLQQDACFRDIGLILNAIAEDAAAGGNTNTVAAALKYFNGTVPILPDVQTAQTIAMLDYMLIVCLNIVKNIQTVNLYQTVFPQITYMLPATATENAIIASNIDLITDIITTGPGIDPIREPIALSLTTNTNAINAFNILTANKDFLAAEVTSYIDDVFGNGFDYNPVKCARDTGLIVDSLAFDLLYQGNSQALFAGLQYWNQGASTIPGEITTTTNAINFAASLAKKVIVNTIVTPLQTATVQVRNLAQPGSTTATIIVDELFTTVTNILVNGPTGIVNGIISNSTASVVTGINYAYNLLQANKAFIEDEVIAYVNTSTGFVYDQVKCDRDVGIIVDALAQDLLFGGTSQSVFAGLQYWNQGTTVIPGEVTVTSNAIDYLRDISIKVINKDVSGARFQYDTLQVTTGTAATVAEGQIIYDEFNLIIDLINNGTVGVTDKIIPNGLTASSITSVQNAYTLLQANKTFLKAEIVAYIESIKPVEFVYDSDKCTRDIDFMVDSVSFDLLYGGNRQAIQSGVYYNGFSTTSSAVANEQPQVTAAYNYIKTLSSYIVTGDRLPVQYQYNVSQVISANTGTSSEIATIVSEIDAITNIINNGPDVAPSPTPIGLTPSSTQSVINAAELLITNRNFIRAEVIAYINTVYPVGFQYDSEMCRRDVGYILDCVSFDLLHSGNRQSIQAGAYYHGFNSESGVLTYEVSQAIAAYNHIANISKSIIKGVPITPTSGNISTQVTAISAATDVEAALIVADINIITDIINNGPSATYTKTPIGLTPSASLAKQDAFDLLIANKSFIKAEVLSFIDYNFKNKFVFDKIKCTRDTKLIVDSLALDLVYEGTTQSRFAALQYWAQGSTVIPGEVSTTTNAISFAKTSAEGVISTLDERALVGSLFDKVIEIITLGTSGVTDLIVPNKLPSSKQSVLAAYAALMSSKDSIQTNTINWINSNNPGFVYNQTTCRRDIGYIIDCVAFDVLHGGNRQSTQAGVYYFGFDSGASNIISEIPQTTAAYYFLKNSIANVIQNKPIVRSYQQNNPQVIINAYKGLTSAIEGEQDVTVDAINYLKSISVNVISNSPVPVTRSTTSQIINTFFEGGVNATTAVSRNYDVITNVLINGPTAAPVPFKGSGFFATTGVSSNDVRESSKVLTVTSLGGNDFSVKLSNPTIGNVSNGTLYFGNTAVFPMQDAEIPDRWAQRRIDKQGAMGGSLVDGGVVSDRSPIQSFVYDAFTQVNQGGRGIHVTNNGYAQLVSVFTIFCSTAVQVDNGGICSITNSNSNFGDKCLVAKGYGKRAFSGTVYNPPYPTYQVNGEYYPFGYYPKSGIVEIFVPDSAERPHISLVMEVEPPITYIDIEGNIVPYTNEQGLPGFLNAAPNLESLTTGTITITGIDTTGINVGNTIYIRDQLGNTNYVSTGTVVVDVDYQSITLNKGLIGGGKDPDRDSNPFFFTLYFCGNAYYTVLSSTITDNHTTSTTVIPAEQIGAEIYSLTEMQNEITTILTSSGVDIAAINFVSNKLDIIKNIVASADLVAAEAVVPTPTKTGTPPVGASAAIAGINNNAALIVTNVVAKIDLTYPGLTYDKIKCSRDINLILRQLNYDLESGGNYYSTYSGLSYWAREGTHHIVNLEEFVNNTALFPDGATVNFYQRSYISASGYLFEYVGAGSNYGALPQRGIADPVQTKEVIQLNNGKVFFTSTDQNGDFRIGPGLVVSQATGVLSGRTFTKSLFANLTPFILAIEAGG